MSNLVIEQYNLNKLGNGSMFADLHLSRQSIPYAKLVRVPYSHLSKFIYDLKHQGIQSLK